MEFALDISHKAISWNEATQTFSVTLSDIHNTTLDNRVWNHLPIRLKNPVKKTSATVVFVKADMDGSQEDTYGWNYTGTSVDAKNRKRTFHFLFIND